MTREQLYQIIFKADSKAGKTFDILLLIGILASIVVVFLESVPHIKANHEFVLNRLEWVFTLFFSAEYILRVYCAKQRKKYIFSFFGLVDLVSTLPSFFALFITGGSSLLVIRSLRLMRVFRVLKLAKFLKESNLIVDALRRSRPKITVFLVAICTIITIVGTLMYLIEDPASGFTSIPKSIYWSVVTITTVGYGDIAPQTVLGQTLASILMIMGYAIIAVPTGIITQELGKKTPPSQTCSRCMEKSDKTNNYCPKCGLKLREETP